MTKPFEKAAALTGIPSSKLFFCTCSDRTSPRKARAISVCLLAALTPRMVRGTNTPEVWPGSGASSPLPRLAMQASGAASAFTESRLPAAAPSIS